MIYRKGRAIISSIAILAFVALISLAGISGQSNAMETQARQAFLLDAQTGIVLLEHNADSLMSPASMSKLMTVLMVFEAIEEGRLALDEELFVSDDAWRRGGSKSGGSTMFLNARSKVSVENLLRGVIIQSGNDACIVLAEALAGSEPDFATIMTERAFELGMQNTNFTNSTGWPHPDHKTTARDLAILTQYLIKNHPVYYRMFAERDFTWNGIRQSNRNPLLYANIGADGLKTGHTEESGYGLVASAEQNGRRLILVLNGLDSKKARASEATRLMNWGFRSFSREVLATPDTEIIQAPVWQGEFAFIRLAPSKPFTVILPRRGKHKMVVTASFTSPVFAPIEKGTPLGTLRVVAPNMETQEVPLVAMSSMAREGVFARILSTLSYLLFRQ